MTAPRADFLELPFRDTGLLERTGGTFRLLLPWAFARFGGLSLQSGWWRLVCEGEGELNPVELRLSSPQDPLIILRTSQPGARVFLRGGLHDTTLLISPWPGEARFTVLRLELLSPADELKLYAAGAMRLARNGRPLETLNRIFARMRAGQAIGVSVPHALGGAPVQNTEVHSRPPARRVEQDGVVAVLAEGERLHPRALAIAAVELQRRPEVAAVYADVIEDGALQPKPEWDDILDRSHDCVGSPLFLRAGADPDAVRSAVRRRKGGARRIALPLSARATALQAPLPRVPAPVLAQPVPVSAIIPTKLRIDLLEKCLDGLINATGYPNLEVIIVDNGSEHPDFGSVLEAAAQKLSLRCIVDKGDFNFSRLVNAGVRASSGQVVLLLNDDVVPVETGWLHRMVASAIEADAGAVGCRLLYPDGTVQHAGVMMGLGGPAGHLWKGLSPEAAAANPYVVYPGQRMAVTGACLAVRREVFDSVGGFDETAFPVAFNDIDFCLRLRSSGLRTVYRGDAVLVHHESQSRGADDLDAARRRRLAAETAAFLARWRLATEEDPFGSPAFDSAVETGAIHPSLKLDSSNYL